MHKVAKKLEPLLAHEEIGWVTRIEGSSLWVDAGVGEYPTRRALSCLVEPMLGDRVLVAVGDDDAFLLAVLHREATGATLGVPGDLNVRVSSGRFRVAATGGVDFVSTEYIGLMAPELKVNARAASMFVEHLSHVGAVVSATLDHIKIRAGTLDSTVDRVTERLKRAYRFVAEFDHVRAGRIDYAAKETLNLRGENAVLTAKELVKVDGSQIHLG
jgi:hypothetical protein